MEFVGIYEILSQVSGPIPNNWERLFCIYLWNAFWQEMM